MSSGSRSAGSGKRRLLSTSGAFTRPVVSSVVMFDLQGLAALVDQRANGVDYMALSKALPDHALSVPDGYAVSGGRYVRSLPLGLGAFRF